MAFIIIIFTLGPTLGILTIILFENVPHPIGKIFRRGKGVPQKELMKMGCLRSNFNDFKLDSLILDPRLSEAQKVDMVREIYADDAICKFTENGVHSKIVTDSTRDILTPFMMEPKTLKRLTSEMLGLVANGTPFSSDDILLEWAVLDDSKPSSRILRSIYLLLNNPRLSLEDFNRTFYKIASTVDEMISNSRDKKEPTREFQKVIMRTLANKHFSDADIASLCYTKSLWLSKVILQSPRCPKEGKVVINLMKGSLGTTI